MVIACLKYKTSANEQLAMYIQTRVPSPGLRAQ